MKVLERLLSIPFFVALIGCSGPQLSAFAFSTGDEVKDERSATEAGGAKAPQSPAAAAAFAFSNARIQRFHWRPLNRSSDAPQFLCDDRECPRRVDSRAAMNDLVAEVVDLFLPLVSVEEDLRSFLQTLRSRVRPVIVLHYESHQYRHRSQPVTGDPKDYMRFQLADRLDGGKAAAPVMDTTNPDYLEWLVGHTARRVSEYAYDGVFLDNLVRCPSWDGLLAAEATDAAQIDLVSRALARLPDRLVIYNGIRHNPGCPSGRGNYRTNLFPQADGALIERFCHGHRVRDGYNSEEQLIGYVDVIDRLSEDKIILVNVMNVATDFDRTEKLIELNRYCLGAFLLGKGRKSFYRFGYYGPRGGSMWNFWDRDLDVPLGAPLGRYRKSGGVYLRRFENGIVYVNPPGGDTTTLIHAQPYRSLGGEVVTSTVLTEKHAVILFNQ